MVSDRISDGLITILNEWTIDQALDAHLALDYLDDRLAEATETNK